MIENKTCPQGYYCKEGMENENDKTDCNKGRYCPEATPEEINCPPGTYNDNTNGKVVNDCKACDAGYVLFLLTFYLKIVIAFKYRMP